MFKGNFPSSRPLHLKFKFNRLFMDWHRPASPGPQQCAKPDSVWPWTTSLVSSPPTFHLASASLTSLLPGSILALLLPQDPCTHSSLHLEHVPLPQISLWLAPPFLWDLSSNVTISSGTFSRTVCKDHTRSVPTPCQRSPSPL